MCIYKICEIDLIASKHITGDSSLLICGQGSDKSKKLAVPIVLHGGKPKDASSCPWVISPT